MHTVEKPQSREREREMGKHRHHRYDDDEEDALGWLSWRNVSRMALLSLLLFWLRYEYHLLQRCTHDDSYAHAKNVVVLNSWACGKGEHYFAHLFSCSDVQKAIDPVVRGLERTSCWYENHALFSSWWTTALCGAGALYLVKTVLGYRLRVAKAKRKSHSIAQPILIQAPHTRGRSPRRRAIPYQSLSSDMPYIEEVFD